MLLPVPHISTSLLECQAGNDEFVTGDRASHNGWLDVFLRDLLWQRGQHPALFGTRLGKYDQQAG